MPVRKGDTVRILRGDNKGFEGKVSRIDRKAFRIYVEGLTREKVDGTNIFLPIHPSKVQIRNLNLDDKWRKDVFARKKKTAKQEKEEKQPTKAEEEQAVTETEEAPKEETVETQPEEESNAKKTTASKKKPAEEESSEDTEETPEETKEEE
jgi:large subunit ribosomal protein L24